MECARGVKCGSVLCGRHPDIRGEVDEEGRNRGQGRGLK